MARTAGAEAKCSCTERWLSRAPSPSLADIVRPILLLPPLLTHACSQCRNPRPPLHHALHAIARGSLARCAASSRLRGLEAPRTRRSRLRARGKKARGHRFWCRPEVRGSLIRKTGRPRPRTSFSVRAYPHNRIPRDAPPPPLPRTVRTPQAAHLPAWRKRARSSRSGPGPRSPRTRSDLPRRVLDARTAVSSRSSSRRGSLTEEQGSWDGTHGTEHSAKHSPVFHIPLWLACLPSAGRSFPSNCAFLRPLS